ncbi:hypothetical protein [Caballeronia mineralivorans]|uniref:hypothetical protein n=1 Tax=Caballeronia mineralivorans TaxID=2010198 RepID=UPI0023F442E4|nr:hypothetical protein [Caballeronia mineralivorans]MDB5781274.1 hypothetical protein [Caballeronia mineralivorans]
MYEATLQYVKDRIEKLPTQYSWSFSEDALPCNIRLPAGGWFEKNLALKTALNVAWQAGSRGERIELCNWYIAVWGGIRRNSEEKMRFYATGSEESILTRGVQGIASWSKALTVRAPSRFAIFDARTSLSLTAIQLLANTPNPMVFPSLPSQNNQVKAANALVTTLRKTHRFQLVTSSGCYLEYNRLLSDIARAVGQGLTNQMVEMVLFADAELLGEELLRHRRPILAGSRNGRSHRGRCIHNCSSDRKRRDIRQPGTPIHQSPDHHEQRLLKYHSLRTTRNRKNLSLCGTCR